MAIPSAELADRALERVGEEDRLAAEEVPARAQLGDEALAPVRGRGDLATRVPRLDDDRGDQGGRGEIGRRVDPERERHGRAEQATKRPASG